MALRVERFALQAVARDILPEKPARRCACGPESRGLRGWGSGSAKSTARPITAACKPAAASELPHLCCQDHGTAAAGSSRRDQPASAGGRRSPAPDPDHPHGRGDDLGQLIQRQAKALQAFFRDFTVRAVLAEMGELGRIRAFEVTHGRKGTPTTAGTRITTSSSSARSRPMPPSSWTGARGCTCAGMPAASGPAWLSQLRPRH